MKRKLGILLIIGIIIVLIGYIVFVITYEKSETSDQQTVDVDEYSNVEIIGNEIVNEYLITEFIKNSEENIDSFLEIELDDSNIKIEFISGTGDTHEENGIITVSNPQNEEDYKEFYGYFIYTVDDEIINEYDAFHYELKRDTEDDIVQLLFYSVDYDDTQVVCEYTLESSDYNQNFSLSYNEDESSEMNIIASEEEFDNTDFEVYVYSGDVEITINDEIYDIVDALENGTLLINDILEQAEIDVLYGICEKEEYKEGGSIEYYYDDYTLLKYNTLDGNRDLVIGPAGIIINTINETKYKEINSIGESTSQVDGVSVTIKSGTLTKTSATIIITDENEETYSYGQAFKIEKKENGSWSEVEHITDDFAFVLLAYNVGDDGTLEMVQDWEGLYGELESGTYRLVKGLSINDRTRNFWVEFTIN